MNEAMILKIEEEGPYGTETQALLCKDVTILSKGWANFYELVSLAGYRVSGYSLGSLEIRTLTGNVIKTLKSVVYDRCPTKELKIPNIDDVQIHNYAGGEMFNSPLVISIRDESYLALKPVRWVWGTQGESSLLTPFIQKGNQFFGTYGLLDWAKHASDLHHRVLNIDTRLWSQVTERHNHPPAAEEPITDSKLQGQFHKLDKDLAVAILEKVRY